MPTPDGRRSSVEFVEMPDAAHETLPFTSPEIEKIRALLQDGDFHSLHTVESSYEEFQETTHAWAVFAEDPKNKASKFDRIVGCSIIFLQLFTYWLFSAEAIEDYTKGIVPVTTTHYYCAVSDEKPQKYFSCEAGTTNVLDAFVAFFLLGIFLCNDILQAARVICSAPTRSGLIFASFAGVEVVAAFFAAAISISQKLYIGEVADAIEVGVGLLFVRELSSRAYTAIRHKKKKQYISFFGVLATIVLLGLIVDPICRSLFAP